MNIVSLSFLVFFVVSLIIYYISPKKFQWITLLAVSVFFYIQADPVYIIFLLFSIASTYIYGIAQARLKSKTVKKLCLSAILVVNLGLLFFLKFYEFGISFVNLAFSKLGITFALPDLALIVPLGIAFYSFQAAGYCIDLYRGKINAERNFFKYALFISYFPHIVQGPIARYDRLSPQLIATHKFNYENVKFGMQLILYGYFKKVVIADRAAILVNQVYQNYGDYSGAVFVLATALYGIQLYCDFSGCVDICRGISQTYGIELENNFNHPYFAISISDFWRKWHISLSSWLRDYVYIPLGGNRKGTIRKYVNIIIVFLVSGLWHGVGIHYIVWGFLHGAYQVAGQILKPVKNKLVKLFKMDTNTFSFLFGQRIITYTLVNFAWIFFRANLRQAIHIVRSIITDFRIEAILTDDIFTLGLDWKNFVLLVIAICIMIIVSIMQTRFSVRETLSKQNLWFRWSIYIVAIFAVLIFGNYGPGYNISQFIYMQF